MFSLLLVLSCQPQSDVQPTPAGLALVSSVPPAGASGVALDTAIVATLQGDGGGHSLALSPNTPGSSEWAAPELSFAPDQRLLPNTRYGVSVDDSTISWSFTTGNRDSSEPFVWTDGGDSVTVQVSARGSLARSYTLTTSANLRDGPSSLTVVEDPEGMVVRSGNDLFDALFALALQEAQQNAVSAVSDGAFNGGAPVPCDCYQTGALWPWVWTRDIAYSADLALAFVDPQRARDSLRFKLSERKASVGGGLPTIVQDTGSGGSWPVSSDRVVWALGAMAVLDFLDGAERDAFMAQAREAIVNTVEQDRAVVFDPRDGLYRGEQSFLDWREQSYPLWVADDPAQIAMGKSLSTNALHQQALLAAAALSRELGQLSEAQRFQGWADDLGVAMEVFWRPADQRFAARLGPELDPSPRDERDLLGEALVARGVFGGARSRQALGSYPRGDYGPPVLWPQQPGVPIYHNRAQWPFVTAYDLRAAVALRNTAVAADDIHTLIRGAALNLSNLENYAVESGASWQDDGPWSGPLVDSQRQLWSVAGYLSMVVHSLLGLGHDADGIWFAPFVPAQTHAQWLPDGLRLYRFPYRGRRLDVVAHLPASGDASAVVRASLDGVERDDPVGPLRTQDLGAHSVLELWLEDAGDGQTALNRTPEAVAIAPEAPSISAIKLSAGLLQLSVDLHGVTAAGLDVFRDGVRVAVGLSDGAGDPASSWQDPTSVDQDAVTHCYSVALTSAAGLPSHHSAPACWWGDSSQRVQTWDASQFVSNAGVLSDSWGRLHYDYWGAEGDSLEISGIVPDGSGDHWLQVNYGNGAGPISSGVAAGVLEFVLTDDLGQLQRGSMVLPQLGSWGVWRDSSLLPVSLDAARRYSLRLSPAPNMSWLQHYEIYGGSGGGADPYMFVNVSEIKLLRR